MNSKQETFIDWVLGTLIYALVLGFFNDYTDILIISSTSTIFFASIVLQMLTFWTLGFKKWVASKFSYPKDQKIKPAKFFSIWAILFFSKFIFLAVIDFVFGQEVEISGFVGLMAIIIIMTILKETIGYTFRKLEK